MRYGPKLLRILREVIYKLTAQGFFYLERNMRTYETVTIVKPQLSDGEVAEIINSLKEFITKAGGEIVSEEKLGRRRFSHEITHVRDGFYVYLKFRLEPAFIKTWDEMSKLNDNILRSMVMLSIEVKAKPAPAPAPAAK